MGINENLGSTEPPGGQPVKGHQCLWPLTCTKNVAFRSNLSITMSARKHAVCKLYSRYGSPVLYMAQYVKLGASVNSKMHGCLERSADVAKDVACTTSEKRAEMTQTCCGNNHQAFGGHYFAATQTAIIAPSLVIISAWGGGKAAHAADAPQTAIDRHGHLDCPHRGREASSSRSVAFPRLGGKKEQ